METNEESKRRFENEEKAKNEYEVGKKPQKKKNIREVGEE